MSRCIAVTLLLATLGVFSAPAAAQEQQASLVRTVSFIAPDDSPALPALASSVVAAPPPPANVLRIPPRVSRPGVSLNVMCVSFAALQAMDLHATFRVLDRGGREANPVLGGVASNKAAMIGIKAATTGSAIFLVRKFGVKNRVASLILMGVANSGYAVVAAHNSHVASSLR
jgi:hypothetical protein